MFKTRVEVGILRLSRQLDLMNGSYIRRLHLSLGLNIAVALAYFIAGKLGMMLAIPPGYATVVWPASGIALAAVLLGGYRLSLGVFAGSFLVYMTTNPDPSNSSLMLWSILVATLIGAGATAQAAVGAALVRRFVGFPNRYTQFSVLVKLLFLAGPVACLVASTIGSLSLYALGMMPASAYVGNWLTWWCGDSIGVLIVMPVVQCLASPQQSGRIYRTLIVSIPLLLSVALTVGLHVHFRRMDDRRVEAEFLRRADVMTSMLRQALELDANAAMTVHRAVAATTGLTRQMFESMAREQQAARPSLFSMGWIPRVRELNRAAFEAASQRDGYAEFLIRDGGKSRRNAPAAIRGNFFPLYFLSSRREDESAHRGDAPPHQGRDHLIGFDLAGDPAWSRAICQACDSGEPVVTTELKLPQSDRSSELHLLIPVYSGETAPPSVLRRRQQLIGFSLTIVDLQLLTERALSGRDREGCEIDIVDVTDPDRAILLYSKNRGAHSGKTMPSGLSPTRSHEDINVAGRLWTIEVSMNPEFLPASQSLLAWVFLDVGLIITSLVGLFLLVITGQNMAVEELVEHRTRELQIANRLAEQASRSKSEFLANMSHEIRTPMTAILGFADILRSNLTQPDLIEAVQTISQNGNFLLELINDILDLSKIEAGKLDVEDLSCSPTQLLADVMTLVRVRAAEKGLALTIEFDGPVPSQIHTDPTRLRQILINLVGNAIKFTERGSVRLIAKTLNRNQSSPRLQFQVCDTGIGMTGEQLKKVFQPFTQADASTTRRFGGTGLGLSISNRLVEMLGGTIDVTSVPGSGTTFTITIPTGSLDGVKWLDKPPETGSLPPDIAAVSSKSVSLSGCRVLLAEDVPANQRLISFLLSKAGAEVSIVENGELALAQALAATAAGQPFDVILMDMQMSVMDGYTATRKLRENGCREPIIALTAHAMSNDQEICLAAGCTDFATKPVDRQSLLLKVANHAGKQAPVRQERMSRSVTTRPSA
jgi:signal transduction histidine kinase/AmiR/NasT family two-component response regulator